MNNTHENKEWNEVNNNNARKLNNVRRKRENEISFKGKVAKFKNNGVARLFVLNYDGFGPFSSRKIE